MKSARGPKPKFSPEEDAELIKIVQAQGSKGWSKIAKRLKTKSAKQCRERWSNYLNPALSFDNWTKEDDDLLVKKYQEVGTQWRILRSIFPNRSVNYLRNKVIQLRKKMNKWPEKRLSKAGRPRKMPIVEEIEKKEDKSSEKIIDDKTVHAMLKAIDENIYTCDWAFKG